VLPPALPLPLLASGGMANEQWSRREMHQHRLPSQWCFLQLVRINGAPILAVT